MKKLLFLLPIASFGASFYLPIDSSVSDDVEKMATITNMPSTKMPYSLQMLNEYNEKIKESNPVLYNKIASKLNSVSSKELFVKDKASISIAASNSEASLANSHGVDTRYKYLFEASYMLNVNEHFKGSIEGSIYEKDGSAKITTNNSFISFGFDKFQVDAGYRDHFYGPFRNGGMQISTNASNSPSITLSNPKPFSFADINYEVFFTKLKTVDGIYYDGSSYSGSPRLLGMHFDFHPVNSLEVSFDRTFQFGGGPRSSSASDVWQAFVDPVSKDNTNSNCGIDCETGNQQASVNIKYNGNLLDKDISVYGIYGGEDTNGENYSLGNNAQGFGVYVPFVSKDTSFRYEALDISTAWYKHHLYANGYSNGGNVIGNWFGDISDQDIRRYLQYIELNNKYNNINFSTKFKYIVAASEYKHIEPNAFYGLDISASFDKTFHHKINCILEKRPDGQHVNFIRYKISF